MNHDSASAPSHRPTAGVFAALLAAGLAWGVCALLRADIGPDQLAPSVWLDGSAGKVLNQALKLPGQSLIDSGNAAIRYRLLGDLGPQVAQGCPDWLFYRDGLRPPPGHPAVFGQRLALMRHWTTRLRQAGVQVLVVAVPDKSRIEADQLCGLPVSAAMQQRLDRWEQALRQQGIGHVDLRAPLAQVRPAFFRTDVHLNARGASAAARVVADAARPLLGGNGTLHYREQIAAPAPRVGDLLVLAGLEHVPDGWRPAPDRVATATLTPLRQVGLLDDAPPVEILLTGSSNGLRSQFAERLGRQLGREVWNLSMDGGQFSGALLAAFKRQPQWPSSLKLVIWEFSEMALSLPLTADEKTALATLE